MLISFHSRLARRLGLGTPRAKNRRRRSVVLHVEGLEDRTVPSTLTVTTNADNGPGSLRAAIIAANPGDTIAFSPSLVGQTIRLTSGELDFTKYLTISVLGSSRLTIDGNAGGRVFPISGGVTATIGRLTIADGLADQGGGIDNAGNLTLTQCTLANNEAIGDSAISGVGGGIFNEAAATLTVTDCMFLHNQVIGGSAGLGFGGGIMNLGQAAVTDSVFQANSATGGNDGGNGYGAGGAIANQNGAFLTVDSSVFRNNLAADGLGALAGGGAIEK